jgi:hypothetical protein
MKHEESITVTLDLLTGDALSQIEEHVESQLSGRVHGFRLLVGGDGLVLQGRASTYYAKHLAQHAVMAATDLPIQANEIEVF